MRTKAAVALEAGKPLEIMEVNLEGPKAGEVLVIAGPSGSGKSTWIRCINRLEEHQRGDIIIDGIEPSNGSLH